MHENCLASVGKVQQAKPTYPCPNQYLLEFHVFMKHILRESVPIFTPSTFWKNLQPINEGTVTTKAFLYIVYWENFISNQNGVIMRRLTATPISATVLEVLQLGLIHAKFTIDEVVYDVVIPCPVRFWEKRHYVIRFHSPRSQIEKSEAVMSANRWWIPL